MHRTLYGMGMLSLVVAAFGPRQLAFLAIPLLFIGVGFHVRWRRGGGTGSARHGANPMDSRLMSRPGLRDRYEGIDTSLTHWPD